MSASCSRTRLRVAALQPGCNLVSSSAAGCVYLLPIHGGICSIGCPRSQQAHQVFIDLLAPATFTTPRHQPAGEGHLGDKPSMSGGDAVAWAFPALCHKPAGGTVSQQMSHPPCNQSQWGLPCQAAPACRQLASQQQAPHPAHPTSHSPLPLPDSCQLTLIRWCMRIGQLAAPQQKADAHVLTWGAPARQRWLSPPCSAPGWSEQSLLTGGACCQPACEPACSHRHCVTARSRRLGQPTHATTTPRSASLRRLQALCLCNSMAISRAEAPMSAPSCRRGDPGCQALGLGRRRAHSCTPALCSVLSFMHVQPVRLPCLGPALPRLR